MKRLHYLLLLCCLVFVACGGDKGGENTTPNTPNRIKLSQEVVEVGFEEAECVVSVTSPYSWEADAKCDWIALHSSSGIAGTRDLKFVVKKNVVMEEREGVIVVENEKMGLYAELYVVQSAYERNANGYEWVDLGLSVMWATCNVGADSPEEKGSYFAWGEIAPKSSYTEANSLTYKKKMEDIAGNSEYDAATANWGGGWRMPTLAEMEELLNDCAWVWTTQDGVNGVSVMGSNGNSIFLPAAGYRTKTSTYGVGADGDYWSSTPAESSDLSAHYIFFSQWRQVTDYFNRDYGRSVRPVIE